VKHACSYLSPHCLLLITTPPTRRTRCSTILEKNSNLLREWSGREDTKVLTACLDGWCEALAGEALLAERRKVVFYPKARCAGACL